MENEMENEMENKNRDQNLSWLDKDIQRFKGGGYLIPKAQIKLYRSIRDHWSVGKTVLDVGCSIGVGANILSHSARHVWGIDINKEAIRFANNTFERPNLSFEEIDIEDPPTRELSPFNVITMIEVIEHLNDPVQGLNFIKRFFSPKSQTVAFITAPNVENEHVEKADSSNELHYHHWTAGEFYELLIAHFDHVTLFGSDRIKQWTQEETVAGDTKDRIVVAKVEGAHV